MDTNSHPSEKLSELERRLSGWQPSREGLDAEAVLFAAGRASARFGPARYAWPVLTAMLTLLAVCLGLGLIAERNERQALAQQLREYPQPATVIPAPVANEASEEYPLPIEPLPNSYLASRQALEKGLDSWPVQVAVRADPPEPPVANPPILRLGQRDALLDP